MLLLPPFPAKNLSPAELLALEEALLDQCEAEALPGFLNCWSASTYFVVLGYGKKLSEEVYDEECRRVDISILRRCSGGGTILQGPGCLNYTVVLPIETAPELATISGTNRYIMDRIRKGVATLPSLRTGRLSVEGCTDLVFDGLKFSGNAQRRKRRALLFHGSILLDFNLDLIARTLRLPPQQPEYRNGRAHLDFLRNIHVDSSAVQDALINEWVPSRQANPAEIESILHRTRQLAEERYSREDWNRRS